MGDSGLMSIRQRFLEAFRLRSEHASSIDEGMRETIASRLIEEYGTRQPRRTPHGRWHGKPSGIAKASRPNAISCSVRRGGAVAQ